MWSEFVDQNSVGECIHPLNSCENSGHNKFIFETESRIWPRAGAAAERLWANPELSSVLVQSRFLRYRERLLSRGIKADAVIPKWCVLNEGQCL